MAHTCEICGMECYCDFEDHHSEEQPDDCKHFTIAGYCQGADGNEDYSE